MATKQYPFISVLLAARNEAKYLHTCLEALANLNYPKQCLEILIGDDDSEDQTAQIAQDFIDALPADSFSFRLFNIRHNLGKAKSKANVLAQLANEAETNGELFLVTDADTELQTDALNALLELSGEKISVVTGFTVIKETNFFAQLQSLDYHYGFGWVVIASRLGIPLTTIGNNMLIHRRAYEETGGYENMPFSVTEDYQLFWQTLQNGWTFKQVMPADKKIALTAHISTWKELIMQRKRWLTGALQLPIAYRATVLIDGLALFIFMVLYSIFPSIAYSFIAFRAAIHLLICAYFTLKTNKTHLLFYFPIYEFFNIFLNAIVGIIYLFSRQIVWKGRTF